MKLLVILLCLLSERYLTHKASLNRFCWFGTYCEKLLGVLPKAAFFSNPWFLMLIVIAPWVVLTGLLLGLLKGFLFGLIGFLIQLFVFYYCMGPDNPFYPISTSKKQRSQNENEAGHYFAAVNNQLFGVIFWYLVLGPLAVLVYRLVSLCEKQTLMQGAASWLTSILDWVPARITVLLYLLVGNFQRGLEVFLKKIFKKPAENDALLAEVGLLAAHSQDDETLSLPVAQTFVEHAMIIYLVLIALFTLVSWL